MTKVFIGGSRRISSISADVRRRIDNIIEKQLSVLIGDANGVDKAVQKHFHSRSYNFVEVFCSGMRCRNNIGGWPVREIVPRGERKDFRYYSTKDRVMADEASFGLMIWDRKSIGTLMNMRRLLSQNKKVVVYVAPTKDFIDLTQMNDIDAVLIQLAPGLRQRIEKEAAAEKQLDWASNQPSFL